MNVLNSGYNPFADLENPEIRRQKEEKDKDYNSKQISPEDLEKSKREAKEIFGKDFDPNYKENLPEEQDDIPEDPFALIDGSKGDPENSELIDNLELTNNNKPEKVKENFSENNKKYETILNNLLEQGQISQNTIKQLHSQELDNVDFEKVENVSEEEKKALKEVFDNIKNPEKNKKRNLENLKKDIKEIQNIVGKENFDFNLEQNNQSFSEDVLNKIGGNYLSIQNKDGKIDYKKNFSLAIDSTKIQIENGVKNINKNSETYRQAIKNISSDNLATKLEGIQSLYVLAYSGEGKFAKKSQEKYKKHRGEKLQEKYKKLNQELQELQKQQTEQAKKKAEQIQQEIESIKKEANEIKSGDIFKATKQETNDNFKEKEATK